MPSTTIYSPGDVVLLPFLFTNQTASKSRPAVILSTRAYHTARTDAIMMPLTSRATNSYGDAPLADWRTAGLLKPSYLKACVQTIEQSAIKSTLGKVSAADLALAYATVRTALGI